MLDLHFVCDYCERSNVRAHIHTHIIHGGEREFVVEKNIHTLYSSLVCNKLYNQIMLCVYGFFSSLAQILLVFRSKYNERCMTSINMGLFYINIV